MTKRRSRRRLFRIWLCRQHLLLLVVLRPQAGSGAEVLRRAVLQEAELLEAVGTFPAELAAAEDGPEGL